jgi:hypothetical protein
MAAMKTLAVCLLILVAGADAAHGAAYSWRWTSWTTSPGVVPTNWSDPWVNPVTITLSSSPSSVATQPAGQWTTAPPAASYIPPAPPSQPAPAGTLDDAYINLGTGPYPGATTLTSGNASPWYNSPVAIQLFGGVPNAQQRADFSNAVLQRVEQTYQLSGVPLVATTDPTVPAAHTLSVVSGTSNATVPNAVGIANQGSDGFSFIDKFGAAQSVDQLEWLVAHNVAHELMHAFGGDHLDTTGTYLDSAVTPWSLMLDPNARFSPAEVKNLLSMNFKDNIARTLGYDGQELGGVPVPETASMALWGVVISAVALGRWKRLANNAA